MPKPSELLAEFKESQESLQELLARLEITRWDWLLVGDGSGSRWGKVGGGWACVSVEQATMERKVWLGACNDATVNFAELMAYVAPLCWLVSVIREKRQQMNFTFPTVHIVTDSEYLADASAKGKDRSANSILWDAVEAVKRQGVTIVWHHLKRESAELNLLADALSKKARTRFLDVVALLNNDSRHDPRRFNRDATWTGPSKTEPKLGSGTSKKTTSSSSPISSTKPGGSTASPTSAPASSKRRPTTSA